VRRLERRTKRAAEGYPGEAHVRRAIASANASTSGTRRGRDAGFVGPQAPPWNEEASNHIAAERARALGARRIVRRLTRKAKAGTRATRARNPASRIRATSESRAHFAMSTTQDLRAIGKRFHI